MQQLVRGVHSSCSLPRTAHSRRVRHSFLPALRRERRSSHKCHGIKFVENFEKQLELPEQVKAELDELLGNATFCSQVATETNQVVGSELEYTGVLFEPVPWSLTTPKGMPSAYEKYHSDEEYVTINVPPNFMFQAKIFKPSRLCAFYKKKA